MISNIFSGKNVGQVDKSQMMATVNRPVSA